MIEEEHIKQSIEKGIRWLAESDIYLQEGAEAGGLRSKYDPKTKEYEVWAGGITDALCTSGFIEVAIQYQELFGSNKYDDYINQSAKHLQKLWDEKDGIMWAGLNSNSVYPLWAGQSANALFLHAEKHHDAKSKDTANKVVKWLISIQNADGSIPRDQPWNGKVKKMPVASWNTWLITTFLEAEKHGVPGAYNAAEKLGNWMVNNQNKDGTFYYTYGSLKSIWRNFKDLKCHGYENFFKCIGTKALWKHPTSQTHSLYSALILYERTKDEKYLNCCLKIHEWVIKNMSNNHLLYEVYWMKSHSIQEDVYPTAILAIAERKLYQIKNIDKYLNQSIQITRTMIKTQYTSDDSNYNGAFPGVPLEPREGHKAYTWDSIGVIKSLIDMYKMFYIN